MFSPRSHTPVSPSTLVSLPSIHEMFPEYLMQKSPHSMASGSHRNFRSNNAASPAHPYASAVGHDPHTNHRVPPFRPDSISFSATANNGVCGQRSLRSPSSSSPSKPSQPRHIPTSPPPPSSTTSIDFKFQTHSASPPSVGFRTRVSQETSDPFICSFDVLRSDPSSSSLEHIASSTTFPNCSANQTSQAGIANGSTPAFRVILPSSSASSARRALDPDRRPHVVSSVTSSSGRPHGPEKFHRISPSTPSYSAIISFSASGSSSSQNAASRRRGYTPDDAGTGSDDGDLSGGDNKRHVCPTCGKRFNRPSSLRIHVNTHTGATPFRCPWPNCGREFNVNSNMRRHFRNHTAPGFSRSHSKDNNRRRRRRVSAPGLVFLGAPTLHTINRRDRSFSPSPPISSLTMSEDSGDDVSDSMGDEYSKLQDEEEDELLSQPGEDDKPTTKYANSSDFALAQSARSGHPTPSYEVFSRCDHFQSHIHALPPASTPHSPSPSSSQSPPPPYIYSPSAPYGCSFTDSGVSTALRPAFNSALTVESARAIKKEAVPVVW